MDLSKDSKSDKKEKEADDSKETKDKKRAGEKELMLNRVRPWYQDSFKDEKTKTNFLQNKSAAKQKHLSKIKTERADSDEGSTTPHNDK